MNKEIARRLIFLSLFISSILLERGVFQLIKPFVKESPNISLGFITLPSNWLYILTAVVIFGFVIMIYFQMISMIDKRMKQI